jgi:hypothetical protein
VIVLIVLDGREGTDYQKKESHGFSDPRMVVVPVLVQREQTEKDRAENEKV